MARLNIEVLTATGFDTKYLFPGSTPHVVTSLFQATGYWDMRTKLMRQGSAGPETMGNYFSYQVSGALAGDQEPYDLSGGFSWWRVKDLYDPSSANLASAEFMNDANSGPYTPFWNSFSATTPDSIVTNLLTYGEQAKLVFTGAAGNDTLRGSFWHDEFDGKGGADSMLGGDGNDEYRVNNKGDKVVEASKQGSDTVFTTINYTLPSNVESLTGTGSKGLALTGNTLGNTLSATVGNDTLKGLSGNDLLAGGNGKDELWGGTGRDAFYFTSPATSANVDTVKDFKSADDEIWLYRAYFPGLVDVAAPTHTVLAPAKFHKNTTGTAHDSSDRIIYDTTDGKLYVDFDGNGSGARQLIAILTGHPTLTSNDIFIM